MKSQEQYNQELIGRNTLDIPWGWEHFLYSSVITNTDPESVTCRLLKFTWTSVSISFHAGARAWTWTQGFLIQIPGLWWLCSTPFKVGFPGDPVVNNLPAKAEDTRDSDWIPELRTHIPWRRNWNPLHYSCLDRGAWWATVHSSQKGTELALPLI